MAGGGDHHHHHADGAHGGDFRAKVWSMTGGANCRPKHWKRNTAVAMAGIVLICIPIAMKSAQIEYVREFALYSYDDMDPTSTSSCAPNSLPDVVQKFWKQGLLVL
ncbi:hypothetical protein SASPL_107565 [Salvia splendens]|uniref:Uncharacterized protein n=1 Tax=Salvia splendens TaxID=180675 RepID=A0A8X8YH24_SALSN|nr:hypothetical protein SASPL_107565 [Salvia splendens]